MLLVEDLEYKRSTKIYPKWVKNTIRKLSSSKMGRNLLRSNKTPYKELKDEALPLALLCECFFKYNHDIYIEHVLGNQNYDAIIEFPQNSASPFRFIEVTQAHEGNTIIY